MGDEPTAFDLGALAHNLRKHAEGTPEREEYLERLRKLVKSGQYRVDAEALAHKLIEEARGKAHRNPKGDQLDEGLEK